MSNFQKIQQNHRTESAIKSSKPEHKSSIHRLNAAQTLSAPETAQPEDIIQAQHQVGNQVVQRTLDSQPGTIQRDDDVFEPLGGGSINPVTRVTHEAGDVGYFKPENPEEAGMGTRSVLSSTIDQALGHNLLARESHKEYTRGQLKQQPAEGPASPEFQAERVSGTESGEVSGVAGIKHMFDQEITEKEFEAVRKESPSDYGNRVKSDKVGNETKYYKKSGTRQNRQNYANPQTQKDLSNIQLQDAITGQHDRHAGNLIFQAGGGARGIDNDKMISKNPEVSTIEGLHDKPTRKAPPEMTRWGKFKNWITRGSFDRKRQAAADSEYAAAIEKKKTAREQALGKMSSLTDNYAGMPTHMDEASVRTLVGTKSSQFMESIRAQNPENFERLPDAQKQELKARYSQVRRFAKVGAADANLSGLDPAKAEKWRAQKSTVMKGAGRLPTIVGAGGWGAKTYNAQMSEKSGWGGRQKTYLKRNVEDFNTAVPDVTYRGERQFADIPVPLPTHVDETQPTGAAVHPPSFPAPQLPPDLSPKNPGYDMEPMAAPARTGPRQPSFPAPQLPRHLQAKNPGYDLEPRPPSFPAPKAPGPLPIDPIYGPAQMSAEPDHNRSKVTNQNGELKSEINDAIQKKRGGGSPLPETVQQEARKILGQDFRDVRVHTDDEAHTLSRSIQARAFTIGKDIFFKRGVYAPGSSSGRETLIHELTHVVQQSGSKTSGRLKLGAVNTVHEKEASQIGKKHASSISAGSANSGAVQPQSEATLQREDDWETDPEPVQETKPDPIDRDEFSHLSQTMVGEMSKGDVSQGLAKVPLAPPLPRPKKPAQKQTGFAGELASKAKSMSGAKQRRNIEKLEAKRSEKVGTRVSQQYKEDLATKPKSFGSKLKGLMGKAGTWGLGKLKDAAKSKANEYTSHWTGKKVFDDKDDKKKEKGGEKDGKSGGGSDVGAMMDKYAELKQENNELKKKLASFENEKV